MALTDNNKYSEYHQPYLLMLWCECHLPLAPVTIVALRELDKVHQYSATDMTLQSTLTQNMAAMCSSWVSPSESSSIHWRYIIQKQERLSVSFFSHLRSAAYRLSEFVPVFRGRGKVTACGFANIVTKWLAQYKRLLLISQRWEREIDLNPFDETDSSDLGGRLCGFVCFAVVDESQIPCLPILSEARVSTLSLIIPFLSSSSLCSSLHLFIHPLNAVFSIFSTHFLPYFCSLFTPHPRSVPSISSLPNNILSSLSRSSFFSSTHLLLPRGNPYFWPVVGICHVRSLAISWSSGDSSRFLYLKSCYGQTRGTGHDGAACWRQSPGPSCTADVGGSRRRGRTQPCCMSGTYWWFPSGGWCPRKVEVQPTWRGGSRNMTKQSTFWSKVPFRAFFKCYCHD